MGIETPNFHDIAKQRKELRGDLLERSGKPWKEEKKTWSKEAGFAGIAEAVESGTILEFLGGKEVSVDDPDSHIKNRLVELDEQAKSFTFENAGNVSEVKQSRQAEQKQEEKFEKVSREIEFLERIEESNLRAEFTIARRSKGEFSETDKSQLKKIGEIKQAIEKRKTVLRENPETYLQCRMHDLKHARQDLTEFGFAAMDSHQADMAWIRKRWEEGNAVLLEGPTGTGKTELLKYLARKLYKNDPEVLRCTERTGPAEIFGKTLLKSSEAGGTETFFQPGRYTTAIDRGVPLLMDEFNQLPTNMRFALKELYNRRIGESVVIQEDTGMPHKVHEGFAWAATANIKSGKHKERFDLDGAESRVFDMRAIGYMPADEIYDLCVATLMDKKGGAHLSGQEAQATLKFLVDAAKEIQRGYAEDLDNHYGMTDARGAKPVLEKAVLDPGSVLRIVSGFKTEAVKGVSFEKYLNERLMDFVSKGDYPEKDRELMIRILMSKGFFQNTPAKEFKLKTLTEDTLQAFRSVANPREKSEAENYLTLEQLAKLDPYGKREKLFAKMGEEFLPEGEAEGAAPGFERADLSEARNIMERGGKEFFLGSEDIEQTFGFKLEANNIPPIPFSKEEIERHQKAGDMLVLCLDKTPDGTPLTMEEMTKRCMKTIGNNVLEKDAQSNPSKFLLYKDQFDENGNIKSDAWFSGEAEIRRLTPKAGWQFVSPEIIQGSTSKNYLAQTDFLIEHAKTKFFDGTFPPHYREAEEELRQKRGEIEALVASSNYVEASKNISILKISQLLREPVQNTIFRYLVSFKKGKKLFTDGNYSWSNLTSSDGYLLFFGNADAEGASVDRNGPDGVWNNLGAVSSRF